MKLWIIFVIGIVDTINIKDFYNSFDMPMDIKERRYLKEKTKQMLLHSYDSYKKVCEHTCDNIHPISCKPRYHPTNVDHSNEFYGNFSLTLIESADTLAIMGLYDQFYDTIQQIMNHSRFDRDVLVSAFEINIRILGGLLSSHSLVHEITPKYPKFKSYKNELLMMAKDVADRLLVVFTMSPHGIPYSRVYMNRSIPLYTNSGTSIADAGTYILEFCGLSHMIGDRKYCDAALTSLDKIWDARNRKYDLPFTFFDVKSHKWTDSNFKLGAGADSYYEYLIKGYIMTGNKTLLDRFDTHYKAIEKHLKYNFTYAQVSLSSGLDILPMTDIFQSFWPSVQFMYGDIKNGLQHYYYIFKLLSTYVFIPESVHIRTMKPGDSSFNLRPEFIESTYHLYKATKDPFFLNVGKFILYSTENYCRSKCGYSSLSSNFGTKLDKTETFFMSEYLKYLYLLFAIDDENELPINLDKYVFNTEAHFIPIIRNDNINGKTITKEFSNVEHCQQLDSGFCYPEDRITHRRNIFHIIENHTNVTRNFVNDFHFHLFDAMNQSQNKYLSNYDIAYFNDKNNQIYTLNYDSDLKNDSSPTRKWETKYQLLHKLLNYKSRKNDIEKPVFIKLPSSSNNDGMEFIVQVGTAFFGRSINNNFDTIEAPLSKAEPFDACTELTNRAEISGKIVVAIRGNCNFIVKARNIQRAGGIATFILNNLPSNDVIIHMISDQYHEDIFIPALFISLLDTKNKDILSIYQNIISMDNTQLQSIKSTIFSTSLSINIVIN